MKSSKSYILVTGAAGYIGSHACVALLNAGYHVVALDNLSNSSKESLARVEKITAKSLDFYHGDVQDQLLLERIFSNHIISAVFHFAGLKAVGESNKIPLSYYRNNVNGTITLCEAMSSARVFTLIFSSSATVYGEAQDMPLTELHPTVSPTNPYGRTKLMSEDILRDLCHSDSRWSIALLRYFNPVGAHPSGVLGEDPNGIPNNLLPYLSKVAGGQYRSLSVFGDDYPTKDGTGVRDYIHVVDLVSGHIKALSKISESSGIHIWNLGRGEGYSVIDVIQTFELVTGKSIPYEIRDRRLGDIAECWADVAKARTDLNWQAELDLEAILEDTWRWIVKNPNGYTQ